MKRRTVFLTLLLLTSFSIVVSGDTSARSCSASGDPSVHHITISPGGPLSMPADQALNITATAYNSAGTELNVPIAWTVSSGSIQNFGGGQARWSPVTVGAQTVTACNGDVHTTLDVNVQPGTPLTFELSVSHHNVTADDTLEITPLLRDQNGNGWIPNIPYNNWELPSGVNIALPNDGTPPILTPGPVGEMTVSVDWEGWTGSTSFNVSLGVAVDVMIQHESALVSSDDLITLCAQYSDQRGNVWNVNSTWSTLGGLANAALSSFVGECIVFDAGLIGDWTVQIEDGNGMSDSLTLTVESGRLAHISLDDLPTEMHIGDFYLLEADGFDAAGNAVDVDGWNWSVTDGPSNDPIVPDGDGITFVPDRIGQHTIQVMAAGRVQAIDVEVLSGIPVSLEIEIIDGSSTTIPFEIVTGQSLDLLLYGVDENGNRNLVDAPIDDWFILNDFGTIENASVGGTGHYTFTADGIGDVIITTFLGQAQGDLTVKVLEGPLHYLEIALQTHADQGTSVTFEISGFDISGNQVSIHQCSATITTDAGEVECDENGWTLDLDTPGELVVHARIQSSSGSSAEGSDFITVHSTWFGWGDDTQVIIAGSILIILIISVILVGLFKHLGSRIEEEIDLLQEENKQSEDSEAPLEEIDFGGTHPPPPQISAPIQNIPNPPPPAISQPPSAVTHVTYNVTQNISDSVISESPVVSPDPFSTLQPSIEVTPESITVGENVEEDWATPEPESEPEPEHEIQTDDEWGEMSGDWGDGGDTLRTAAATFAQIQYENRRGDGPRDAAEQTLKPLPGTNPGEDGWYFDREGRPSEWRHTEENGWRQE
ncbi:MAG: hypothetical protein VX473_03895 [Candidatus Thermoplasmatota archaeon]|nr:hypothetical protein [Candidatus Thermoplasmatota archaeon]